MGRHPIADDDIERLTRFGYSASEIAIRLDISARTVTRARARIRKRKEREANAEVPHGGD